MSDYAMLVRRTHSEYVRRIRHLFTQGTEINKRLQRLLSDLSWFQPDADDMEWEGTATTVFVRELPPSSPAPCSDVRLSGVSGPPLA